MADKIEKQKVVETNNHQQVEGPKICKAEGCKHKPQKFAFCQEHYELYMAGVLRGDGKKPLDYDQKFAAYKKSLAKSA